jgi:hypothetical protein
MWVYSFKKLTRAGKSVLEFVVMPAEDLGNLPEQPDLQRVRPARV